MVLYSKLFKDLTFLNIENKLKKRLKSELSSF